MVEMNFYCKRVLFKKYMLIISKKIPPYEWNNPLELLTLIAMVNSHYHINLDIVTFKFQNRIHAIPSKFYACVAK